MELMTTAEVAEYLRIKERTVYEMAAKRQIPCTRATGKLLFSRRMLERWVESRTEVPESYDAMAPRIYAGSSDPLLEWTLRESGSGLAVLASGSRAGLETLARGEALMAGLHVYEPETKTYNVATLRRELPFPDAVAIRWAKRAQGLLLPAGNPLGIAGLDDLFAKRPRIALRPGGAGSRILLDVLVQEAGADPGALNTLDHEAQTEADLAAMIAEGEADCGLGIAAVAKRSGLAFVPLGIEECFDLALRRRDYFEPPMQKLLAFARSEAFTRRAEQLGGYDVTELGTVTYNG